LLSISRELADEIIAYCKSVLPNEACGVLAGDSGEEVTRIFPVKNLESSPVLYRMDPAEEYQAFAQIYEGGLDDIGFFHSHPNSEAIPSATDIREVKIGLVLMMIVSLEDMNDPEIRLFSIGNGEYEEEQLCFV
tara:strand:+ start:10934 stop:11335 length:402 start_codon:yes stop_codon:yes gene_type:complete